MSPSSQLRVLLLQARRDTDPMRSHEVTCFASTAQVEEHQISVHDLCAGPPKLADVKRYDAVMVGGSGEFYVSARDLPHFDGFVGVLQELCEVGHPMFGSCFGYQSLVECLGGDIIHDPGNTEVGTIDLELTDCGRTDPLFGPMPPVFTAQMGHKDRATRHPAGIPNLAQSQLSPFQALRIPDKPIWATQFHPELDRTTNLERFQHYLDIYAQSMDPDEREKALAGFRETPHASNLLARFLDLVFG